MAARFFQLKGLALDYRDDNLYATDGHAVRRITPQGLVASSGFKDRPPQATTAGPCCHDPNGLAVACGGLYIADTGNHAVRELRLSDGTLRTLAGDPRQPAINWGLLRDGLEDFPGARYATLRAPRGLATDFSLKGEESLYLTTGPCLGRLSGAVPPALAMPRIRLEPQGPLTLGEGFEVDFTVSGRGGPSPSSAHDFDFEVECRDPDGTPVGPPRRGSGSFDAPVRIPGRPFTLEGTGRILVRVVTLDGLSCDTRTSVSVSAGAVLSSITE